MSFTSSILPEKLKDFDYYLRKLPQFLRQSESFTSHFRIWYDLLMSNIPHNSVVGVADTLFNLLNIFDQDIDDDGNITNHYLEYIKELGDIFLENTSEEYKSEHPYGNRSDILDKIGELFGVRRSFDITYVKNSETIQRHVYLDNQDFLLLIKSQIIQHNFDGSYAQIKEYYKTIGLYAYVTTAGPAISEVYLVQFTGDNTYQPSEDVQAMFLAGLLTIKSMGITYYQSFINLDIILIWNVDADGEDEILDSHGWGEDVLIHGTIKTTGGEWII